MCKIWDSDGGKDVMLALWLVTPHGLAGTYQHVGGTFCLRLQGWFSETLICTYKSTRHYKPEDRHRHFWYKGTYKSHFLIILHAVYTFSSVFFQSFYRLSFVCIFNFLCMLHVHHLCFFLIFYCDSWLLGEYYKLWSSTLCVFLRYPAPFSLSDQDIVTSILLWTTPVKDQVSHSHKTCLCVCVRRNICKVG